MKYDYLDLLRPRQESMMSGGILSSLGRAARTVKRITRDEKRTLSDANAM